MAEARTTYTLKEPIVMGSETITELQFRKPRAKDFRPLPIEGQTVGQVLDVMGKLCGQPPVVMDELSAEDFGEVAALFSTFMPVGPTTGSGPSRS